MKLEEIMKNTNKLFKGEWFKREHKAYCIRWNSSLDKFEYMTVECDNENKEIEPYCFNFDLENFWADDWKWVEKEKWYEGDFKKKYPNGVLCWVWNGIDDEDSPSMRIVMNYDKDSKYPFKTYYDLENNQNSYKYAIPVKPKEAPAIIGGKDE